jgi:hypothetical protein
MLFIFNIIMFSVRRMSEPPPSYADHMKPFMLKFYAGPLMPFRLGFEHKYGQPFTCDFCEEYRTEIMAIFYVEFKKEFGIEFPEPPPYSVIDEVATLSLVVRSEHRQPFAQLQLPYRYNKN